LVIVLGANGQLGLCLKDVFSSGALFWGRSELDITNNQEVQKRLASLNSGDVIINATAYTNVDKAESEVENATEINVNAIRNLREACRKNGLKLIHVSTDYVFDGKSCLPLTENDKTSPLGVYGETKREGEEVLVDDPSFNDYIIFRTSWLYSEYNKNFLKTMLSLKDKEELKVVFDQIGTPTYAGDLAELLRVASERFEELQGEIYHYSNEGVASWYDFAKEIFWQVNADVKVIPVRSGEYPTLARRPHYSVLDKCKIKNKIEVEIPHWKESLKKCLEKLSY
jgi:dTDP-4-dehydrorhamnose reductase